MKLSWGPSRESHCPTVGASQIHCGSGGATIRLAREETNSPNTKSGSGSGQTIRILQSRIGRSTKIASLMSFRHLARLIAPRSVNALRETHYFWIPLGLLDVELSMECVGDFCTDDAMSWDEQRSANSHHAAPDSLEFLLHELQVNHS